MNEESTAVVPPEFERKPLPTLVTLDKFKELVGIVEMLFNLVNDRMSLGVESNDLLAQINRLKEEINEAEI